MNDRSEKGGKGAGRRERVGGSGVYPASGPPAPRDAEVRTQASWGRREKDADSRGDAGVSELNPKEIQESARKAAERAGE